MTDEERTEMLLHALADGEVDAATTLSLERTMADDPAVRKTYERILAIKAAVSLVERPIVSDAFAARIAALAQTPAGSPPGRVYDRFRIGDWQALAASVVMTAALASGVTYSLTTSRDGLSIQDSVVDGHRRSLLSASPIDIASSDRHTVRPWFDAKLGVSPPAPDLSAAGFQLLGGRVDIVGDRPVPSLVYRHKEHLITVVAIPATPGRDVLQDPIERTAGAYNVVRWSQPGFSYWAISDLDRGELSTFVSDMREH